jgi:hypothetical protein
MRKIDLADERDRIERAIERLFERKPIRSSGALNVVTLAKEAGVKRGALTHRHVALKEEFQDRVQQPGADTGPSCSNCQHQKVRLTELRAREEELLEEVSLLTRAIRALSMEIEHLSAGGRPRLSLVPPLPPTSSESGRAAETDT